MLKKEMHCKAVSAVPSTAQTGAALKLQYLGDFLVYWENMTRSAAWGVNFSKDGSTTS